MPDQTGKSLDELPLALQRFVNSSYTLEEAAERIVILNERRCYWTLFYKLVLKQLYHDADKGLLRTGEPTYSYKQVNGVYQEIEHQTATGDDLIDWCDGYGLIFYQCDGIDIRLQHTYLKCFAVLYEAWKRAESGEEKPDGFHSFSLTKNNGDINFNRIKEYLTAIEPLTPATFSEKLKEALEYLEEEKKKHGR